MFNRYILAACSLTHPTWITAMDYATIIVYCVTCSNIATTTTSSSSVLWMPCQWDGKSNVLKTRGKSIFIYFFAGLHEYEAFILSKEYFKLHDNCTPATWTWIVHERRMNDEFWKNDQTEMCVQFVCWRALFLAISISPTLTPFYLVASPSLSLSHSQSGVIFEPRSLVTVSSGYISLLRSYE